MPETITIRSRMAERDNELALAEGATPRFPTTTWTGTVTEAGLAPENAGLGNIFRAFNVVEDDDAERLERIGYRLPSLSVGDEVTLPDGRVFRVGRGTGWEEVTNAWRR